MVRAEGVGKSDRVRGSKVRGARCYRARRGAVAAPCRCWATRTCTGKPEGGRGRARLGQGGGSIKPVIDAGDKAPWRHASAEKTDDRAPDWVWMWMSGARAGGYRKRWTG